MNEKYDFGGYATRNDLLCSDGRTIRKDAFKDCDGKEVPLVWQHNHSSPSDVLGHALLENRDDGVYAYGAFNLTEAGKTAKQLVQHKDVKALSIYANQLVQKGGDVLHGMIREVSLCLAGANPGAMIEDLSFEHFDDENAEFEARIYNGDNIELAHSDELEEDSKADSNGSEELQHSSEEDKEEKKMADETKKTEGGEKTVKDVYNSLTDEQKKVVEYMIGYAVENAKGEEPEEDENEDEEEDKNVKHNAFYGDNENTLSHSEVMEAMGNVIKDGKKYGTLKDSLEHHMSEEDSVLAHAIDTTGMDVPTMTNQQYKTAYGYGINEPSMLFPEARSLNTPPEFIGRNVDWVKVVMNGVHRTPFSRIKSLFANITEDDARAKGYIKGNMKKNEFFSLMKRTTVPQTIYKKQKMDRDDIVDITDFDVVAWIKGEMRVMLDEEIARAILVGDDRLPADDDKISEEHIRPIVSDAPLFTIKTLFNKGADEYATAKNMMKAAIRSRKDYRGSGNPTLFTTEDALTSMLLIEDGVGHYIYKSEAELATALRVRNIVTVPVMEGYKDASENELMGIIVNLNDYNVGADKGGAINMFDDFNIDYNQYIYLIETRCSGALIKPYSAIALFAKAANA